VRPARPRESCVRRRECAGEKPESDRDQLEDEDVARLLRPGSGREGVLWHDIEREDEERDRSERHQRRDTGLPDRTCRREPVGNGLERPEVTHRRRLGGLGGVPPRDAAPPSRAGALAPRRGSACVRSAAVVSPAPRGMRRSSSNDGLHRANEVAPLGTLLLELSTPALREPIHPPASAGDRLPAAGYKAAALQAVERGIHRAFGEIERTVASLADGLDELLPMGVVGFERREQEEVNVSFSASRTIPHYT
jgi:hypothetical protein